MLERLRVQKGNFPELEAKLQKLNKRLRREDPDFYADTDPQDADRKEAQDVVSWLTEHLAGKALSDYEYNLRVLLEAPWMTVKHTGYAASMVRFYQREMGNLKLKENSSGKVLDEYFGEVKKRETWELVVSGMKSWDSEWGTTTLVKFGDCEGRQAAWFASKDPGMELGEKVVVKATVKKHDVYQGKKQTVLTRVARVKA